MSRLWFFPLMALIVLGSCKTTHEDEDSASLPTAIEKKPESSVQDNGCPPKDDKCPASESWFALCTASRFNGKRLVQDHVLQGFGQGPCRARSALKNEACRQGKSPSLMGDVVCVPDPSGGQCPPKDVACPETQEPQACSAGQYDGQKLLWELIPKAYGRNGCEAMANLKKLACQKNLQPSKLQDVHCEADPTQGECPPKDDACGTEFKPVICRIKKVGDVEMKPPLVAAAVNSCVAKIELMNMVCKRAMRPSLAVNIECVADRFSQNNSTEEEADEGMESNGS